MHKTWQLLASIVRAGQGPASAGDRSHRLQQGARRHLERDFELHMEARLRRDRGQVRTLHCLAWQSGVPCLQEQSLVSVKEAEGSRSHWSPAEHSRATAQGTSWKAGTPPVSVCLQAVVAGFNALDRARALVQLTSNTGSERATEWALIYFCLRAGLHKEALQVSHDWLHSWDGTGVIVSVWAGQGRASGAARLLLMAQQKDTADLGLVHAAAPAPTGFLSFLTTYRQLQLKAASLGHGICCSAQRTMLEACC